MQYGKKHITVKKFPNPNNHVRMLFILQIKACRKITEE